MTRAHKRYMELCLPSATDNNVKVPVAIFGTAGTRLIGEEERAQLWKDLNELVAIKSKQTYGEKGGFDINPAFQTISGEDEGFFAMLSVNLLKNNLDSKLTVKSKLEGVLDLGGASTQIAAPTKDSTGSTLSKSDVFVKSYLGFGTAQFWKAGAEKIPGSFEETCSFGAEGGSKECQTLIKTVFDAKRFNLAVDPTTKKSLRGSSDQTDHPDSQFKAGDMLAAKNSMADVEDFYAISGFFYAKKFALWLLGEPSDEAALNVPNSISQVGEWAEKVCAMKLEEVKEKHSSADKGDVGHTSEEELPMRCFQLSYITVLLRDVYRWPVDEKKIVITEDVGGNAVDWPLGAFMYVYLNPSYGGGKASGSSSIASASGSIWGSSTASKLDGGAAGAASGGIFSLMVFRFTILVGVLGALYYGYRFAMKKLRAAEYGDIREFDSDSL